MFRPLRLLLAILALVVGAAPLAAQTGEALIREIGGTPAVTDPTFRAPTDLTYRMAWRVTEAPAIADDTAIVARAVG